MATGSCEFLIFWYFQDTVGCLSGRHASQIIRLDEDIAGNSIASAVQKAKSGNRLVPLGPSCFITVHCESIVFNQTSVCFHERAKCFSQVHNADLSCHSALSARPLPVSLAD